MTFGRFMRLIGRQLGNLFVGTVVKFVEVNRRYAKPRVKTTPLARVALLFLRLYLLFLVGILIYKFITLVK